MPSPKARVKVKFGDVIKVYINDEDEENIQVEFIKPAHIIIPMNFVDVDDAKGWAHQLKKRFNELLAQKEEADFEALVKEAVGMVMKDRAAIP